MIKKLTIKEKMIIKRLKKIAKAWPKDLWLLFGTDGIMIMKYSWSKNGDGGETRSYDNSVIVDIGACVEDLHIPGDKGDW